jgi:hypothetical protein
VADRQSGPKKTPRFEVALAEFSALRQEIGSRSTAQHTLLTIQLSTSGTVLGVVLGQVSEPQMLLVIPILSFAFGMLWLDHAANIARLGVVIRTTLNERLSPETELPDPLASEASAQTFEANVVWRWGWGGHEHAIGTLLDASHSGRRAGSSAPASQLVR